MCFVGLLEEDEGGREEIGSLSWGQVGEAWWNGGIIGGMGIGDCDGV